MYIAPNIRLLWRNVCQVWSAADGKRKFLLLASVVDGNSIPASPAALTLGAAWRKAASISSLTSSAGASAAPDEPAAKLTSVCSLCSWSVGDSTQLRLRQICLFSLSVSCHVPEISTSLCAHFHRMRFSSVSLPKADTVGSQFYKLLCFEWMWDYLAAVFFKRGKSLHSAFFLLLFLRGPIL